MGVGTASDFGFITSLSSLALEATDLSAGYLFKNVGTKPSRKWREGAFTTLYLELMSVYDVERDDCLLRVHIKEVVYALLYYDGVTLLCGREASFAAVFMILILPSLITFGDEVVSILSSLKQICRLLSLHCSTSFETGATRVGILILISSSSVE